MGLASPMHPIRPQPLFALHPSNKPKKHSEQPRTKQLLLPSCQRRALELHFALVVPTKAGTRPAVHGCRPHFRRALAGALAIDHCPDPEIGGWHSVARARKPRVSLDPFSEPCMTRTRSTHPECLFPVKTHGLAPTGWSKWNRRDSDFSPARLRSATPAPCGVGLANARDCSSPGKGRSATSKYR